MRHKKAITAETRKRYTKATKKEKTIILNQLIAITGYNRCYASQILSIKKEKVLGYMTTGGKRIKFVVGKKKKKKRKKPRIYTYDIFLKLKRIWVVFDFICGRKLGGPDAAFSVEPEEFKQMVKSVREVEKALGEVSYKLTEGMKKSREHSRSLFVVKDIKKGEDITKDNIKSIRPGYGLHPRYLNNILGKKAKINIKRGTPLNIKIIK